MSGPGAPSDRGRGPGDLTGAILEAAGPVAEGAGDLTLLYVDSWRRDLGTATALLFSPPAPRPVLVAKLGIGAGREAVRTEHDNLEILARSTDPGFRRSVPRALIWREEGEWALLIESAARGTPLEGPRDAAQAAQVLELAADWLLAFHGHGDTRRAPLGPEDRERLVEQPFREYARLFRPGPDERRFLDRMLAEARALAGTALPLVYAHGDFCVANLFRSPEGLEVIDWEMPLTRGLPLADLIHLIASISYDQVGGEGVEAFERAFLGHGSLGQAAGRVLGRQARALDLPPGALAPLFTVYWLEYAREKVRTLADRPPGGARRSAAAPDGLGLVRFAGGSCVNLKRLAERERELVFR